MARANTSTSCEISSVDVAAILSGHVPDPFAVFGPRHRGRTGALVVFDPHATEMVALTASRPIPLTALGDGIFLGDLGRRRRYRLRATDGTRHWEFEDPYRFGPVLGDLDLHLIAEGTHRRLWQVLGAHPMTHDGV
ncbi:MAG: 1,4-alpha-glucan branching enzyme, partial [Rhodobacteraceae bacterium]|nr:1,4-alpha-glucan branching enzyme [Paracoccaceae bacterium]